MSSTTNAAAAWVPAEIPPDAGEAAFEPEWWVGENATVSPFVTDVPNGSRETVPAAATSPAYSPFRSLDELEALDDGDVDTELDGEDEEGIEDGPRGEEALWAEDAELESPDSGLGAQPGLGPVELDHPVTRLFRLPATALEALAKGAFPALIAIAGAAGYRGVNDLTNIIFYFRYPHVIGRRIRTDERDLQRAWRDIRDTIVRPAIAATAPSAAPVPMPPKGRTSIPATGLQWRGPGPATPELLAFMREVYNRHVNRSRGTFVDTLPEAALDWIYHPHKAQREAARKARELLTAARADNPDPHVKIGIRSAYRSADKQFDMWQSIFPEYYTKSKAKRQSFGDEHGPQAADYLVREIAQWIAAPGYSNHQDGLAIDFNLGVSSKGKDLAALKKSWFYKWLTENAHRFDFKPYPAEPWHWDYKPRTTTPQSGESRAWPAKAATTRPTAEAWELEEPEEPRFEGIQAEELESPEYAEQFRKPFDEDEAELYFEHRDEETSFREPEDEYETEGDLVDQGEAPFSLDEEAESDQPEEFETADFERVQGYVGEETDGALRTLEMLLEHETGSGSGLTDRLRAVAAFVLGPPLRRGANGPAVAALQRQLVSLGHDLVVDGDFGTKTERAVRAFQAEAGIPVDGAVEQSTKSASAAALAKREQAATTALCSTIARIAEEQFRRWRPNGGLALRETDPAATPILQEYYRTGVGMEVTAQQLQSAAFQSLHPWSAVFISWVLKTAGAGGGFLYSRAHQSYIRAAHRSRMDGNTTSVFWAYRATELAPQVGDLVCASRANSGATFDNIVETQLRATHCDIVTEVRPGELRVIGGNLSQSVGAKKIRTQPNGFVSLDGPQARIFAILRCRSGPAPDQAAASNGSAKAAGMDARILRVMELLVSQYGYPVNAAAGVVGNLIAESGVMPNRIEGSRPESPMRARDFTDNPRDFTPEEIRDRDFNLKRGPRLPGVGLAQWTSPERRAGLFRHTFRGRQLDTAILFDLDGQVDYLVTELKKYSVNRTLLNPGVSVNAAADDVVYRFEVPGAVLENGRLLPRSDPRVQEVFVKRRAYAQRALRVYRTAHS